MGKLRVLLIGVAFFSAPHSDGSTAFLPEYQD